MTAPDLFIVVRTNGERTVDACRAILEQRAPRDSFALIQEKPFYAAVEKTYELGAESGARWLLALDADVLLHHGAIEYVRAMADAFIDDSVFRIDFPVTDKFRGRTCAGAHLYNNRYSGDILAHMRNDPQAPHCLREESDNVVRFCTPRDLEFHRIVPAFEIGLHDHHQFLHHIWNKYRTRYERCQVDGDLETVETSISGLMDAHPDDVDFAVAMAGLRSSRDRIDTSRESLRNLKLAEKTPLDAKAVNAIMEQTGCVSLKPEPATL